MKTAKDDDDNDLNHDVNTGSGPHLQVLSSNALDRGIMAIMQLHSWLLFSPHCLAMWPVSCQFDALASINGELAAYFIWSVRRIGGSTPWPASLNSALYHDTFYRIIAPCTYMCGLIVVCGYGCTEFVE